MSAASQAQLPGSAPSRVLIVEDEFMLLDMLGQELEDFGYRVLSAMTGEDAVRLLCDASNSIDLLVTDIRLPGSLDGWDIAEQARQVRPSLPVIYVTGFNDQVRRDVSDSIFILKPYRPSAIVKAARRLGIG